MFSVFAHIESNIEDLTGCYISWLRVENNRSGLLGSTSNRRQHILHVTVDFVIEFSIMMLKANLIRRCIYFSKKISIFYILDSFIVKIQLLV